MKYEEQKSRLIEELQNNFRDLSKDTNFQFLFSAAISKVNQLNSMSDDERMTLIEFGEALAQAFKRINNEEFFRLAFVAPYLKRIEQQSAIIDAFYEKEKAIMQDDGLDEEQREMKLQDIRRLKEDELDRMTRD